MRWGALVEPGGSSARGGLLRSLGVYCRIPSVVSESLGTLCVPVPHPRFELASLPAGFLTRMSARSTLGEVSLIWICHIGMDRMIGYGLKYPLSFKNTHLQRVALESA